MMANPRFLSEKISTIPVDEKPFIEAYVRTGRNGDRYLGFETRLELGIKPDQNEDHEFAFFAMRYSRAFLDFAIADGPKPTVRRYNHEHGVQND